MSAYDRVQKGWIWIVLPVLALVVLGMGFVVPERVGSAVLFSTAALMFVLAASMAWLRVRDDGDRLSISYGPLPLIRRQIDYARITGVERVKPPALLGVGIRWAPGFGWTWNVDTGDLVRLQLGERAFHVGAADPDALVEAVSKRITVR